MIADAGYRVIIPDLYKGQTAVDKEEASHIMSNLDFPAAIEEVGKTAEFLFSEGSSRIGIIGFCMGGALTLGSLAKHDLICAGASFYGFNQGLFRPEELNGKAVQGHFGGELIGFSDITAANKLRDIVKAHAQRQQEQGFPPYDANQVALAWGTVLSFFDTHLKQSPEFVGGSIITTYFY